jgi:hypothetical protein
MESAYHFLEMTAQMDALVSPTPTAHLQVSVPLEPSLNAQTSTSATTTRSTHSPVPSAISSTEQLVSALTLWLQDAEIRFVMGR